ncbi:MAG: glycoside hydrolase family 38 C-terminal domain-containing protein, partial [Planctomycetota bacterium]
TEAIAGAVHTHLGPKNAVPLLVFNGLNWPRTEPVTARVAFDKPVDGLELLGPDGKAVPFEVEGVERTDKGKVAAVEVTFIATDVPPMGHTAYAALPSDEPLPRRQKAGGLTIENDYFRITADPAQGGGLTSLFDKKARRELIHAEAGPGNELVALEENPSRREPAWELYTVGPKVFSRKHAANVTVETGPVSRRLVVHGEMTEGRPDTAFKRRHDIVLYRGVPRIYFRTRLDHYRGAHHLYAVTFPAKLRGCQPVFETAFGATSKRPSKGKLDFRTSQWRNDSDCGARRCANWFELGRAATLKAGSSRLAIGMVNLVVPHDDGVVETAHVLQDALVRKGVPVTPQFDDCDMARREGLPHEDACLPTPDHFDVDLKYGMSFRISLDVNGQNQYTAGLLQRTDPRRRAAFFRRIERDKHGFLLTYDEQMPGGWAPLPVLLVSATSAGGLKNAVEDALARFDKTAILDIDPRADVTSERHVLDDYGIAVLNRGNLLGSVEADNTLCLFLMHTAAWGNSPWGKDRLPFFLVPEHKSHLFHYALYPHRGDWRKAKTYRAGLEYNHPLRAVQATRHKGPIDAEHSYLQLEGDSLVLSALKPAGNPTAAFQSKPHDLAADGLLVRWYEAEGKTQKGQLTFFQKLTSAKHANLLEEPGENADLADDSSVAVTTDGFAIDSLTVVPEPPEKPPLSGRLGPEHEPASVVHFRHWQHNAGAAPIGYSPVAIALRGDVKTRAPIRQGGVTVNALTLSVANGYTDHKIKGKATLHVGPGWHTIPEEVPYELEPGEHQITPVLLAFDDARRDGWVKARLSHGGRVYQDVLRVGKAPYIEMDLDRTREELSVELHNPGVDPLEGSVAAVTPLETWPQRCVGAWSLAEVEPREHPFAVPPGETVTVGFTVRVLDEESLTQPDSMWAVLKVACNGLVDYIAVPGTSIEP